MTSYLWRDLSAYKVDHDRQEVLKMNESLLVRGHQLAQLALHLLEYWLRQEHLNITKLRNWKTGRAATGVSMLWCGNCASGIRPARTLHLLLGRLRREHWPCWRAGRSDWSQCGSRYCGHPGWRAWWGWWSPAGPHSAAASGLPWSCRRNNIWDKEQLAQPKVQTSWLSLLSLYPPHYQPVSTLIFKANISWAKVVKLEKKECALSVC